jgi:phospholipid/cholesterol/gamma-HCH transport system substrate-binding protein
MSSAAKVGAFMLVVLAILGFFIIRIEDLKIRRARELKKVDILFDTVAGLDNKSAVRVAGVRVGKVDDINLTPGGRARVTVEIDSDVKLHQGATARIASLGLLGEQYVEIDTGNPRAPEVSPNQPVTLSGSQTPTIDQVTGQISAIAIDVKAITESLRSTMAGPRSQQRLDEIVENIRQITAKLRLVIDANQGNVNATAENLRKITDDLRVEIPRIADSIDRFANNASGTVSENREDVRIVVENLRGLSADLKVTAKNLDDITGQVRSGEGTVGKLVYSNEAHDRLTSALQSVESGVNELKSTLGRMNRLQMDLGIKGDYYAGLKPAAENIGGSSRSALTLDIVPNPERDRFYHFELADDPFGTRHEKLTTTITTDQSGQTTTVTQKQIKTERNAVISAQAGWTIHDMSLRVGLFDGAGGGGVDYRLSDRLSLTGEAFDFGKKRDVNPHLRLFGQYVFRREKPESPTMFVSTGVDNVFNDTAFTIGGGIRWRDDDLKYLLGSVPVK